MALSLEAFVRTFGEGKHKKIRKRGYIAYNDKHVLSFNFDRENGVMYGKVMPSQRSGAYNVKVSHNLWKNVLIAKVFVKLLLGFVLTGVCRKRYYLRMHV